jgi:spermidine synthase
MAESTLLFSVFIIAACGLLYELAAGALASYLLGDSVLQFSTIIGTYLFAMGLGSYASRYIERQLPAQFLRIQLLVGVVGGLMPAALFLAHSIAPGPFRFFLYGLVLMVGFLVGLEIPLVMRILNKRYDLKDLVSQVLTFDYLGALAVSIAFPLFLVPKLGLIRSGLMFGLLNAAVALWTLRLFKNEIRSKRAHTSAALASIAVLLAAWAGSNYLTTTLEEQFYSDRIVFATSSSYQRVVVTQGKQGARLFLNGNLQFAERDEYRYHEALVHPAMSAHGAPKRVAVLGGGDGMAVREILKYASVESVTLVELDPTMTELFTREPMLLKLNSEALRDKRVRIINSDAYQWLESTGAGSANTGSKTDREAADSVPESFDVIIVDFPDPSNFSLGKLYTHSFYTLLQRKLAASGYAVIQSTSPLIARNSFWTVVTTIESTGMTATPYHAHVPSFGEWGFIVASRRPWRLPATLPSELRFLSLASLPSLFDFPVDMARVPTEVNRLHNQVLVRTFESEWGKVLH